MAVVALDGELTPPDASLLRHNLLRRLTDCPDALLVDLGGIRAADEQALTVFQAVRRRASVWPQIPLLLCSPTLAVAAKLARMGLERIVPVYQSRAAAVAASAASSSLARADQELAPSIDAPAQARELVAQLCRAWGLPDLAKLAQLIVSELVTNAVTYAGGGLRLSAVLRATQLHLIVRDQNPDPPRPRADQALRADQAGYRHGHGLRLVDAFADSWGYLTNGAGKAVWARLRVTPARRPGPPRRRHSGRGEPAPG